MGNLRKIFEHFAFYGRSPALEITEMRERLLVNSSIAPDDRAALAKILDAVVSIAESEAKKAAKKAG